MSSTVLATMLREAFTHLPMETGGILLGAHINEQAIVIYEATGPGPDALHTRNAFDPDQEWQEQQVADAWQRDNSIEYLGDWHTHPRGRLSLSRHDKSCMKLIRDSEQAHAPKPLMLVLAIDEAARVRARAWVLARDRLQRTRILIAPRTGEQPTPAQDPFRL